MLISFLMKLCKIQNYTEGEFCYGHKYEYLQNGALQVFNIRMKKIKKFAKALLATKFISMGSVIAICILRVCSRYETAMCFLILFGLIYLANNICNVIFLEKLNNYFSESNFYDFEKFSKCDYIQSTFKRHYKFINTVNKNCKRIFIVSFISSILEAINVF